MFRSKMQKSIFLSLLSAAVGLFALYVLVALAAAGDLDPSFAGDGIFTDNIAGSHTLGRAVIVQPDGKIVVGGATDSLGNSALRYAIARFNPDGSWDTSFANDGRNYDVNIRGIAAGLALNDDGTIVQCGFGTSGFTLFRYSSSGVLDSGFGLAGYARLIISGGAAEGCESLAIQPDDKIIAAGWGGPNTDSDVVVARFSITGTLDTGFDSDGYLTLDIVGEDDRAHDVIIQPNGKIVIAGDSVNSGVRSALLARFDSAGVLDTTFGVNGIVIPTFGASGPDVFQSIVQLGDGKLLVAGSRDDGNQNDIILLRYSADGAIDTTFGTNGVVTTPIGNNYSLANGLAVLNDGKIFIAGSTDSGSNNDVVVIRYLSNGTLDPGFGTGGVVTLDLGFDDEAFGVDIQADGRIVIAGVTADAVGDEELLVARFVGSSLPIADAGLDKMAPLDSMVTLDGSGSSDPDGELPLTYQWLQTGGIAVTLSDDTAVSPTFNAPNNVTDLIFTLTVTDDGGLESLTDEVVVDVRRVVYIPIAISPE